MARILFIAGERFCESPDETFFNGQCLPIGSTEHCPSENMSLVDEPDNNGFCDCLDTKGENNLQIIFSDQTGRCYSQNTRGPCNVGEWFVLNDIPRCESIPNECPDDGRHVYGKIRVYRDSDPSVEAGCWEIGRTCPDEVSVVQVQQDDYGNLDVFCSSFYNGEVHVYSQNTVSLVAYNPCRKGTRRSRNGDCLHRFFG
ncbi:hypothetical protein DAPPUDRAFT_106132 [Daphnia pulex]|uniref:DUF4789 domain-containing protein n=1 Tax=Daphnia pulex TaxID=6669 RepID=E9GSV0_DAPPU|nr:hypothetical protein DAPPUDRAFT_106132 [Daphnia pulex]|eukprot:EFX77494.1 hypothetical protein DAPPUDRAFT_106132 [Daphnia pulex]